MISLFTTFHDTIFRIEDSKFHSPFTRTTTSGYPYFFADLLSLYLYYNIDIDFTTNQILAPLPGKVWNESVVLVSFVGDLKTLLPRSYRFL